MLLDDLFAFALDLIGFDALLSGQVDDLLTTFGIENVVRIEQFERSLFEEIDGGVFQAITIQVATDDANDLLFELIAFIIEVDEVHLLADGLERFRKLGLEELFQRLAIAGTNHADRSGDFQNVSSGFIDAHEEGHFDISANVV